MRTNDYRISTIQHYNLTNIQMYVCRTMQNYLTWQLIIDRVNSLSRRFKDARARYRKVRWTLCGEHDNFIFFENKITVCVCLSVCVCVWSDSLWDHRGGRMVARMCPVCPEQHGERGRGSVRAWDVRWREQTNGKKSGPFGLWNPLNKTEIIVIFDRNSWCTLCGKK